MSNARKACVECRFFRRQHNPKCAHPTVRKFDHVYGYSSPEAKAVRGIAGDCSFEGKLFEPWPPTTGRWIGPTIMFTMITAAVLKMWGAW